MKSLHVRNLDERVLEALKRLAKANHRSLQGELHFILENAAKMAPLGESGEQLNLITVNTGIKSTFSRDEIYGNDENR